MKCNKCDKKLNRVEAMTSKDLDDPKCYECCSKEFKTLYKINEKQKTLF